MSNETTATAVRVQSLKKTFYGRAILEDFELEVRTGEFVALLGKSGSGKTTFLRILAGLEPYDSGQVLVPQPCTVVFQEPRLVESKRVIDNVLFGLPPIPHAREKVLAALGEVGLEGHAQAWPVTLSGGEAQRVSLARALLREPRLLLLDEPFAALDALTRIRMQSLVADLCARHRPAALLVTHDVDEAILLADRVLVLDEGRIAIDLRVNLEKPRAREGAEFDRLRNSLLAALGLDPFRAHARTHASHVTIQPAP